MAAQQLATVLTAIAGGVGAVMALYFWRKATGLYALLVEGANRFEELRSRSTQLEQALLKTEERVKQGREAQARLERALSESREKGAELLQRFEAKDAEGKISTDKLELQKNFLEKQLLKAQDQLRQSEEARDGLLAERNQLAQTIVRAADIQDKAVLAAKEDGKLRERELLLKAREMEAKVDNATKLMNTVDPNEIRKVKRKIAQYDRLYASMKGLREMTEERNRNWEVALKKLSGWIIHEHAGAEARLPEHIGPLVGRALELIGAQLIDDNDARTGRGAQRADHMDGEAGSGEAEENLDETEAALAAETAAAQTAMIPSTAALTLTKSDQDDAAE